MTKLSDRFAKILLVGAEPEIRIRCTTGSVRVIAGADEQVAVEGTKVVTAFDEVTARQALDAMQILVDQDGETMSIATKYSANMPWLTHQHIELVVTLPVHTNLSVNLSAGHAQIDAIAGTMQFEINAGDMQVDQTTFVGSSNVRINAGSFRGKARLDESAAFSVSVNSGSANLSLPVATSAHLDASANAGNLVVDGWPINIERRLMRASAAGDLMPNPTGSITIAVNAGRAVLSASA